MARIRSFKPEFWTDSKTGTLSGVATKLFMGMWNHCDDYGVIALAPLELKAKILPYEVGTISEVVLKPLVDELLKKGLVQMFFHSATDAGIVCEPSETAHREFREYLYVVNFLKHQRVDKPGDPLIDGWNKGETLAQFLRRTFPFKSMDGRWFTEQSAFNDAAIIDGSENATGVLPDDSGSHIKDESKSVPRTFRLDRSGKDRKGTGKEKEGKGISAQEESVNQKPTSPAAQLGPSQSAGAPGSDLMVEMLVSTHPRVESPIRAQQEAVAALERESGKMGGDQAAYEYLLERTKLYRQLTDQWPEDEREWIVAAHTFFAEQRYRADERLWVKGANDARREAAAVGANTGQRQPAGEECWNVFCKKRFSGDGKTVFCSKACDEEYARFLAGKKQATQATAQ